jgi:hypothetical protein
VDPDDDDTIDADPDDESVALTADDLTDGSTPGETKEVGLGVGEDD